MLRDDPRLTRARSSAASELLARERTRRLATVAELDSLVARIRLSVAAEKRRYAGLRAEVRRLLDERRQAELSGPQRPLGLTGAGD